jgi:hypothetical protein
MTHALFSNHEPYHTFYSYAYLESWKMKQNVHVSVHDMKYGNEKAGKTD